MKSLKALAKELGVSTAAVSYVYHGKWKEKRISEALAVKIREALEREGVRPSLAGIQLKTGRSMAVGVLLPDFETPHWMEILKGVESVMTPSGLLMLLANTKLGMAEGETMASAVSRGVDGLIMSPHTSFEQFAKVRASLGRDVPIVFVDTCLPESKEDYVVTDNRKGAFELVKSMLGSGRKRVAYIGSAKKLSATSERYLGYCDALKLGKGGVDERFVKRVLNGAEGLTEALGELLDMDEPPDALFVESLSYFKLGFQMLSARDVCLPEDLLLAGFDSFDPRWVESSSIDPRSVLFALQDGEAMGRLAAARLKELINDKSSASGRMKLFVAPIVGGLRRSR